MLMNLKNRRRIMRHSGYGLTPKEMIISKAFIRSEPNPNYLGGEKLDSSAVFRGNGSFTENEGQCK
jgi:hypothetical protein